MKKEIFKRAKKLRWQIECLTELTEHEYQLRYTRDFKEYYYDYSDHLTNQLSIKVCEWNSQLKTLIAEEIAALEKEFDELSDDTMIEEV